MRNVALILSIFSTLFFLSSMVQAETTLVTYNSPKSISQAMDLAVKSNSLTYLYTQETSLRDTTHKIASVSKPVKLKSPTAAFVIALVPGSVVHGAGHFYAGKPKTGFILLGAEIISLGLIYGSALSNLPGNVEEGKGDAIGFIGLALFAGSWLYDIIEAPFVIKNRNDRILGKEPFEP